MPYWLKHITDMSRVKEKLNCAEEILRIKREGQDRSRQLVRDGIRTQESMFLIPPDVAKASKVRYRGLVKRKQ